MAVGKTSFVKEKVCVEFTLVAEIWAEEELGVFGVVLDLLGVTAFFLVVGMLLLLLLLLLLWTTTTTCVRELALSI